MRIQKRISSGIFDNNVNYLILDGSYVNLKNEAPYFSDVKIENKDDSIMIYFSEELKIKNGEETYFNSVIAG